MDNLTAKVSAFSRAYHHLNYGKHVFDDAAAYPILGEDYNRIAESMEEGIGFFIPGFEGSREEGLRLIVERQLAPSVLARSAYCEEKLKAERKLGAHQYAIFAAGYDTSGIRYMGDGLEIYELDYGEILEDKIERISASGLESDSIYVPCDLSLDSWKDKLLESGFDRNRKTFGSLLGISYYLKKDEFSRLLMGIGSIMAEGSAICLDYPEEMEGIEAGKNRMLAKAAGEEMKASYSEKDIIELLSDSGFLVYEMIHSDEATERYFKDTSMKAPLGVGYLLAVKKL